MVVNMDQNQTECTLTGDQAIDLIAAALAGVPYAALAYSFKLDEAEVQALIAACQEQGLSAWCQAQQPSLQRPPPRLTAPWFQTSSWRRCKRYAGVCLLAPPRSSFMWQ